MKRGISPATIMNGQTIEPDDAVIINQFFVKRQATFALRHIAGLVEGEASLQ